MSAKRRIADDDQLLVKVHHRFAFNRAIAYLGSMRVNSDKALEVARRAFAHFGRSWTEMRKHALRRDGMLVIDTSKSRPARPKRKS